MGGFRLSLNRFVALVTPVRRTIFETLVAMAAASVIYAAFAANVYIRKIFEATVMQNCLIQEQNALLKIHVYGRDTSPPIKAKGGK
jgi:hypothetical protein